MAAKTRHLVKANLRFVGVLATGRRQDCGRSETGEQRMNAEYPRREAIFMAAPVPLSPFDLESFLVISHNLHAPEALTGRLSVVVVASVSGIAFTQLASGPISSSQHPRPGCHKSWTYVECTPNARINRHYRRRISMFSRICHAPDSHELSVAKKLEPTIYNLMPPYY